MNDIKIYTPDSKIRRPLILIKSMFKDLVSSRELTWRLFLRDINAQYRQSILGLLWLLLNPILTTLMFVFLNNQKILNVEDTGIPYPLYVLLGTTLWQLFTETVYVPTRAIRNGKAMLLQVKFPSEALYLSALGKSLFDFVIKLIPLAVLLIYYEINISWTAFFFPISALGIATLGMTIGFMLVPLSVLYDDIERSLVFILQFWFFITPVVYTPPQNDIYVLIDKFNPISPLITGAKELIISNGISDPTRYFTILSVSIIFLFVGWILYRLAIPILAERLNA